MRTDEDFRRELQKNLKDIEERLSALEAAQDRLSKAFARSRAGLRRNWLRPPMWTFEQYAPRKLDVSALPAIPALPATAPRIGIVTPTYNYARYLGATIDSVLSQNYPNLVYHVQDGGSTDETIALLKSYGDRITWRSEPDNGQSHAINAGFAGLDCDIMAYLNSDDVLLPGALAAAADFFAKNPDVDVVYGHRVFIDRDGLEIGRSVLPAHDNKALHYACFIPQETMFWRRRVWDAIGPIDESFRYALDWDFELRAQAAGFRFARLRRFLACFRVHDEQKTSTTYDVGHMEMQILRKRYLGHAPGQQEIYRALFNYLVRQFAFHWFYKLRMIRA
ncbi:MAG: glycosyltransferase family 2 protein [Pseudomonadota bacterium]